MSTISNLSQSRIVNVALRDDLVVLDWGDGHRSEFHFFWLRDNCRCELCGDRAVGQKLTLMTELARDCAVESVCVEPTGDLVIDWKPDDHKSHYAPDWLRAHCYSETERRRRRHRPMLWASELQQNISSTTHVASFRDEAGQYRLLKLIREYGFALVHGVPGTREDFDRMVRRIGYPRETNYGHFSDLVAAEVVKTLSNTKHRIPLHTDEGYRHANPGMLAFQCLSSSADGEGATLLADGFNIATHVRDNHPEAFELLSRVSIVSRRYRAGEMDLRSASPVISVDYEGRIQGVRFNERSAAPLDVPAELVKPVYEALRVWQTLANDPAFQVRILLVPGDFVVFDNQRVLHGRDAFGGHRHLLYCQLDLDEAHSRSLVLSDRLGEPVDGVLMHRGT